MAQSAELPKTSQPSIAKLESRFGSLKDKVIPMPWGLFFVRNFRLFIRNIQYMLDEYDGLTIAFPDTHITSLSGFMVENALNGAEQG